MEAYEPFISIGIALGAGLLIGLQREQSHGPEAARGSFLGGVRTYPLFALLGALSVVLVPALSLWFPFAVFLSVLVLIGISYTEDVRRERDRGLTTEASILVTFLLGALAATRNIVEPTSRRVLAVAALAVVVTFLLSAKPRLHTLAGRVSQDDLYATVKFLILAVLVLPLLPDMTMGPLQVINPFQVGLMVVLIAGISFVGYVASRTLGTGRGLTVTALVGGLVSSTAVTLAFAGRARKEPQLAPLSAAAIVLASTIMFARVLVEVAVVHRPLVAPIAVPMTAMAVVGAVAGALLFRRVRSDGRTQSAVPLENPFELSTALRFGLLFAGVLLGSKAAQMYAGDAGMYITALLAGTTDVDAITLSTAHLARNGLDPYVAATTILLGAVSNTITKAVMAAVLGGWALGRLVVAVCGAMVAAALLALAGVWLAA